MAVTIKTIASATGLSVSTVSRALTQKGRVHPSTRRLVNSVADELGYRPNEAAKMLVTGRSKTLGLIVPTVTNPFFTGLLKGAQARARMLGYSLILADSDEDETLEQTLIEEMSTRAEGLIVGVTPTRRADAYADSYARKLPSVFINREHEGIASVRPDMTAGIRQAVEHLAALGHQRIGYLGANADSWMNANRLEVIASECTSRDLQLEVFGPYAAGPEGGMAAFEPIRASGVTAVIAFNDLAAMGLMSRMFSLGFSCPADLSVIGIDDIYYAPLSMPPLTTIRVSPTIIGRTAVDLIVSLIEDEPAERALTVETELVVRGSTARPPSD